jgi:hypothetical protein
MKSTFLALSILVLVGACATSQQPPPAKGSVGTAAFSILPGAPVYAEATVNADGSITLTKVESISNPAITLSFDLSAMDDGMMLSVKNPLDKPIKYHLNMIDRSGKPHQTSSCPVHAGISVFEMWPHPIPEIRVSNAHVASKSEEGLCIY